MHVCRLSQINVGDLVGISKATSSLVVRKVTRAVARLAPDVLSFPSTRAQQAEVMRGFYAIAKFPGVLGAIDCTHIPLQSPGGDQAELFRNRKGYFSLNVQAVASHDLRFINIVSKWHGSTHDATIFSNSRLCHRFESGEFGRCFLLGDGGYPAKSYLLTPLASPATESQQRYKNAHIVTRNVVERAFGVLKRRFPCLRHGLRVKVSCCLYQHSAQCLIMLILTNLLSSVVASTQTVKQQYQYLKMVLKYSSCINISVQVLQHCYCLCVCALYRFRHLWRLCWLAVLHNLCIETGDDQVPDGDQQQQPPAGQRVYEDVPVTNFSGSQRPGATAVRDALITSYSIVYYAL